MAFSSTTQRDNERYGNDRLAVLFKGTAGASGNTITLPLGLVVEFVIGLPNGAAWSQSSNTLTITGLTNGNVYNFNIVGTGNQGL